MSKPRVVIIRNATAHDFGGGERFPVFLAQGLAESYQPIVISHHARLLEFADRHNIETIRGPWWKLQNWSGWRVILSPVYILWQLYLVGWYLGQFLRLKPAVVHVQSKDDFIGATVAARLVGARVIWTDHADLKHIWKNLGVWYKNPVGKLVYACAKLAQRITVVSNSELRLVTANLSPSSNVASKIQVIYNGVFDQYDKYPAVPQGNERFTFCTASRLVRDKGIGELLAAFEEVRQTHPESQLIILGDGPERDMFDKAQAGVEFRGHVSNPIEEIATCDVFVHPTYHEGFSVALVEASMLGRAIIATDVGGNPEIITDEVTGLLVPSQNTEALTAAMLRLIDDPQLSTALGKNARQQYEARFSFDKIVKDEFIPLYEKNNH